MLHLVQITFPLELTSKTMQYLQAKTKSALWLGPTYLYSDRASQTISRKFSRRMNADVRLLYNSKGTLLNL